MPHGFRQDKKSCAWLLTFANDCVMVCDKMNSTYKQRGASEADESHKLVKGGSTPSPAIFIFAERNCVPDRAVTIEPRWVKPSTRHAGARPPLYGNSRIIEYTATSAHLRGDAVTMRPVAKNFLVAVGTWLASVFRFPLLAGRGLFHSHQSGNPLELSCGFFPSRLRLPATFNFGGQNE